MDYPKMIKEYREKNFISQTELGNLLGVSYVTVNRWENGHFRPTLRCKRQLNELFKQSKIKRK